MTRSPNESLARAEEKIPVAVIGVGEYGRNHAQRLGEIPGAELVGVYDRKPERARAVAVELGVRAFESLEAAFSAARAACVVIPTSDHFAVARQALVQGVDVFLEKPITRTLEEADALIECAAKTGRILQVGHLERFNPGVVAARRETHQPLFFEIHRLGVFSPRSLDVDVVFDLMIHDLDLVLWLVGAPVRDVRAVGLPVLSSKVDIANARVEFENGVVANFTASRVSTERVRKFRYFQSHEYFSIDFARKDAIVLSVDRNGPPSEGNGLGSPLEAVRGSESPGGPAPGIQFRKLETRPQDPLAAELEAFVESVRTRQPPLVGGREGRAALALAARVMNCIQEHAARLGSQISHER